MPPWGPDLENKINYSVNMSIYVQVIALLTYIV